MIKLPVKVRFEQAVYGSFPFWNRGYAVLAHSAGCRPEWLAELRTVCQRYGEPPAGTVRGRQPLRLAARERPVDDRGRSSSGMRRPGPARRLAFHALFVGRWAYRWAGADPFAFAGAIRRDWSPADQRSNPARGTWTFGRTDDDRPLPTPPRTTTRGWPRS